MKLSEKLKNLKKLFSKVSVEEKRDLPTDMEQEVPKEVGVVLKELVAQKAVMQVKRDGKIEDWTMFSVYSDPDVTKDTVRSVTLKRKNPLTDQDEKIYLEGLELEEFFKLNGIQGFHSE